MLRAAPVLRLRPSVKVSVFIILLLLSLMFFRDFPSIIWIISLYSAVFPLSFFRVRSMRFEVLLFDFMTRILLGFIRIVGGFGLQF